MKRFLAGFLAVLMLLFALVSCNNEADPTQTSESQSTSGSQSIPSNSENDSQDPITPEAPEYEGMTVANEKPQGTLMSNNVIFLGNNSDHINQKDPFEKGDNGKHFKDTVDKAFPSIGSVDDGYYAKKNSDVYILIHFKNPSDYEIQSFTLGGKKYANYMFEDGSTMELIIIKVNVGDAKDFVEYTIDAIKYIDGTDIKDVKIKGNKTVRVNIIPHDQPTAAITDYKADSTQISLTLSVADPSGLIPKDGKSIHLIAYDGESIVSTTPLSLGTAEVTVDKLERMTVYQFAVIAVYNALDGNGTLPHVLTDLSIMTTFIGHASMGSDTVISWTEIDFEGQNLNIIARDDYKVSREWSQEDSGNESFTDIVAQKNNQIASDLNLNVRFTFEGDQWASGFVDEILWIVQADVNEGMSQFDIVASYGYLGMSIASRDLWANLLDRDSFPLFDFSLKCWNQSLVENSTVNGKMYLCAGDFNYSMFDSAMVLWHNKDLYQELLTKTNDTTSPRDIQDCVIKGDWIYAELYKWANYHENLDPESNSGDIFGLYMNGEQYPTQPFDAIPYAWDIDFMLKDAQTGKYSYNFIGNEKADKAMHSLRNLWCCVGTATETTKGPNFPSGKLLFQANSIWLSDTGCIARREMEGRVAVLPWPKYDENQDHYATTSQDYYTTMSVINHSRSPIVTKGEAISAYLQYNAEASYTYTRVEYFWKIVEQHGYEDFNDETTYNSIAIFNCIVDNLEFDFATIYSPMLGGVVSRCWRMNVLLKNDGVSKDLGTTTVVQKFQDNQINYEQALADLYAWFGLTE